MPSGVFVPPQIVRTGLVLVDLRIARRQISERSTARVAHVIPIWRGVMIENLISGCREGRR